MSKTVTKTLIERIKSGEAVPALKEAVANEKTELEFLAAAVAEGKAVIPANPRHRSLKPCGIGKGLRTKVNANIGTSGARSSLEEEKVKLRVAVEAGADAVMDLSTGGVLSQVRSQLLEDCPLPFGTVPIYEAALRARENYGSIVEMTEEDLFAVIEEQAQAGVDFMTVHAGLTSQVIPWLKQRERVADVVSRGGALMLAWMLYHEKENPLYTQFDRLLAIARRYEVVLSLGDALRPGAVADATDRVQVHELLVLGELVRRCREAGVQAMVEGPGHVPLNQIEANIILQKRICQEAPFYVLGPLVTDVAPGYDHITSAIGGALAAMAGADFLCYVTPAEHLGLPGAEEVRQGVIAARIAAHAADLAKGIPAAWEWDQQMSMARRALDWEAQERLALDPAPVRAYRKTLLEGGECTMCGPLCAMKVVTEALGGAKVKC